MHFNDINFQTLTFLEIRSLWEKEWGMKAHARIGRKMMERSLFYKLREKSGYGLNPDQKKRLNKLITTYKRNPNYFDQGHIALKPGMRFIRNWKGKPHTVTITAHGFSYQNKEYSSLSTIASEITGSRWNGWLFFGLKNKKETT